MGEEFPGPMAPDRVHYDGQTVSSRTQDRKSLGRGAYRKSCLARRSGVRRESWDRQVSAPRPPQDLRSALSCRRRRTGANPVSARSRLNSDNRTISPLQTAHSRCGQRQNWNRATGLRNRSLSVLPTIHQLAWFVDTGALVRVPQEGLSVRVALVLQGKLPSPSLLCRTVEPILNGITCAVVPAPVRTGVRHSWSSFST